MSTPDQRLRHAAAQRRYMTRKRFTAELRMEPTWQEWAFWLFWLAAFMWLLAASNGWIR